MDTTIEGFAFQGDSGGTGIYAEYDTYLGDNLTVRHCHFDDDLDEGIQLEYSWNCDIHDCMFDETDYAIYTANTFGDVAYARIHNNWFYDCNTCAIHLPDADRCHIYENSIYNNDAASLAAAINTMINLNTGSRNSVHHNTLSCILGLAVVNWDYGACNKDGAGDAWVHNYCLDGVTTSNP